MTLLYSYSFSSLAQGFNCQLEQIATDLSFDTCRIYQLADGGSYAGWLVSRTNNEKIMQIVKKHQNWYKLRLDLTKHL